MIRIGRRRGVRNPCGALCSSGASGSAGRRSSWCCSIRRRRPARSCRYSRSEPLHSSGGVADPAVGMVCVLDHVDVDFPDLCGPGAARTLPVHQTTHRLMAFSSQPALQNVGGGARVPWRAIDSPRPKATCEPVANAGKPRLRSVAPVPSARLPRRAIWQKSGRALFGGQRLGLGFPTKDRTLSLCIAAPGWITASSLLLPLVLFFCPSPREWFLILILIIA